MRRSLLVLAVCLAGPVWAQTIAVLPLFNLSGDSSLDWVGESVSEAIRETLVSGGMIVVDRESRAEAYRRLSIRPYTLLTHASVIKLGEELDADRIVYGTFQVPPGKHSLALAARVLDRRAPLLGPEETAASALEDLAEAQQRLAWQVSRLLAGPGAAAPERSRRKPVRVDALESYIRGLMATSPEQKHRLLTQAARLDENYAQPCFQLGRMLFASKNYKVAAGWFERVPPDNPNAVEATFFLGLCRYELGEYDAAIAALRKVSESAPLSEVWNDLGAAQSRKNLPEAAESFRKASAGDPGDPAYLFNLGYALWKRSEFDQAAQMFRAVLDLTPEDPQAILMLGRCLQRTPPRATDLRLEGLERVKDRMDQKPR
jgi:tetratricopeptide (TPR) repeat protein